METSALGPHIQKIKRSKGLSQGGVAQKLKISQSAYSKLEREGAKITLSKLEKIADIFDMSLVELISFDTPKPNNRILSLEEKVASLEREIEYLREIFHLLRNSK